MSLEQAWNDYQAAQAAHTTSKTALVNANNAFISAVAVFTTARAAMESAGVIRDNATSQRDVTGSALDAAATVLMAELIAAVGPSSVRSGSVEELIEQVRKATPALAALAARHAK